MLADVNSNAFHASCLSEYSDRRIEQLTPAAAAVSLESAFQKHRIQGESKVSRRAWDSKITKVQCGGLRCEPKQAKPSRSFLALSCYSRAAWERDERIWASAGKKAQRSRYYDSAVTNLLHDDTFRRLCRGRDLLASEYASRVLLGDAARQACLSEFHFHRLFRSTFGQTPHDFLTRLRLDRARQLLASERSVTEVCFEVGYESLGTLSSKFRARFGRSPVQFQREVQRVFGYHAPWRILRLPECLLGLWAGLEVLETRKS